MNGNEILRAIEHVQASPNKGEALAALGIPRATYYSWLRAIKERGRSSIKGQADIVWKDSEVALLKRAFSKAIKLNFGKLTEILPHRTRKAIEGKMRELGLSILQHNRAAARSSTHKRCTKCKRLKAKAEFYRVRFESLDGLHVWCRDCILEQQANYRASNQGVIRERESLRRKRMRLADPHYSTKVNQLWRRTAKGAFNTLAQRHRCKTRRGSASFCITEKEFVEWFNKAEQRCSYCGLSLEDYLSIRRHLSGAGRRASVMTIDRLDSNRPYSPQNIGFACYLCNSLKGYAFSEDEFRAVARKFIVPRLESYLGLCAEESNSESR